MRVTMIMVASIDGVIAKDENQNAFEWTSAEDKQHFVDITKRIGVVLMGGNTFKASGRKSYSDRVGFVLTRHPENYDAGENIHFVSGTPGEVLAEIAGKGYEKVALIGGAKTNAEFLKADLVDEIYLTIEPKMFGQGLNMADGLDLKSQWKLLDSEKLNDQGTLLLHYERQ